MVLRITSIILQIKAFVFFVSISTLEDHYKQKTLGHKLSMNQSFTSTVIAGLGVKTVQYQQIDTATYHDVEIF